MKLNEHHTDEFETQFKFILGSFIIDTVPDINFDIYNYFGITFPNSLFEDWNFDDALPFYCNAKITILSNGMPLTSAVTVSSEQYSDTRASVPPTTLLRYISSREQHSFDWNQEVKLPIFYSEIPVNAILNIKFYSKLFESEEKLIGEESIQLFTKNKKRLRNGLFILSLDGEKETKLQKHVRKIGIGREKVFEFVDNVFFSVATSFHPKDSNAYFDSILNPLEPIKLSTTSKFARINILSPLSNQSIPIIHKPFMLKTINNSPTFNPCQNLYSSLSKSKAFYESGYMKDAHIAERFNVIKSLPPLAEIQAGDKDRLRTYYQEALNDQDLIPALFRSIRWDEEEANSVLEALKKYDTIDIEYSLEFFTDNYEIEPVRQFAVRCISKVPANELILYIPQLVQASKRKYTDGLPEILLSNAKDDIIFATNLYWNSFMEKQNEYVNKIYSNLLNVVSEEFQQSLNKQKDLIDNIHKLLLEAQEGSRTPKEVKEKVKELLNRKYANLKSFEPTRLPFKPELIAIGINPENIRCFQSKLKPVMLDFILNEEGKDFKVIFKIGDDMRQDQLIIQLFSVMDNIFKSASLDLSITPYATLAFSSSFGCCEFVENSKAIQDIKDSDTGPKTIRGFLEENKDIPIQEKIERYTKSLAGYCVMTYVLKIGDRHDNNILVTRDGRLLHIDYGYILGDVTKPFTPPLKLSQEMVDVIGPDGFEQICNWAGPAFNSLRKRARLILILLELMFQAPINCLRDDPFSRLHKVENNLQLNCSEIEAFNALKQTFFNSLNSKTQKLWEKVHVMAIAASAPSA